MGVFLESVLAWTEPREARRHIEAEQERPRRWVVGLGILVTFAVLLAPRFFVRPSPTDQPPPLPIAVLIALAGAATLVLGYPWLEGLFPVYYRVKTDRIIRSQGQTHQIWALADVESYARDVVGPYYVFTLRLTSDRRHMLGITSEDAPALEEFFQSRGCVRVGS